MSLQESTFLLPGKIVAGPGVSRRLGGYLREMGVSRVIFVTDRGVLESGTAAVPIAALGKEGISRTLYCDVPSEPKDSEVDRAAAGLSGTEYDAVVALGGGSVIDFAKGLEAVLASGGRPVSEFWGDGKVAGAPKPIIAVPTTAGTGSEVSRMAMFTDTRTDFKVGIRSYKIFPALAVLDAELTVTLPPGLTAGTALDALTHAIEAFTCLRASPFTDSLALGAIELIGSHLRRVLADGRDLEARHNLLMAAAMAGMAMANAGLGLVHSISQPLGTRCRLPHGLSNAVLLPYVLEFNRTASPAKFARVAAALGKDPGGRDDLDASGMAVEAVEELLADAGLPRGLSELGVTKEVFPLLCEDALKGGGIRNNPRPAGKDDIAEILRQALG